MEIKKRTINQGKHTDDRRMENIGREQVQRTCSDGTVLPPAFIYMCQPSLFCYITAPLANKLAPSVYL